jgi:hypothetical protein
MYGDGLEEDQPSVRSIERTTDAPFLHDATPQASIEFSGSLCTALIAKTLYLFSLARTESEARSMFPLECSLGILRGLS